jgi:23S rRNA (cytidine1920-2'-O)/16S rRNA (cytidine1409-2'-O)-methyltransferase
VVRDADDRRAALLAVAAEARALGTSVSGFASSGLPGPKGNLETFVHLTDASRPGAADLEAAVRQVEP